ncbi:MAG: rhomboid family intramembrane serine protease [Kovacikia sp.]
MLYRPLIGGVLPARRGVSWQGHLFGFIGGVLTARYLPQLHQWLSMIEATLRG